MGPSGGGYRVEEVKAFLLDIIEDDTFLEERRKLLRQRAGLSDKDKRKVPKFQFIIVDRPQVACQEVESDHNFNIVMEFLAGFAHDIPPASDIKEALAWCSMHYKLNPWSEPALHQEWADTEGGILRSCAAYCLDRFQRYQKSRKGHDRMDELRAVIHAKLEAEGMLSPEGKKIPTRGLGKMRLKQVEAAQRAVNMDNMETQLQDSQSLSPISKMPDFGSPEGPSGSVGCLMDDGNTKYEESADEECPTTDEEVEVIALHENVCSTIDDESDSVLSPKKATQTEGPEEGTPEAACPNTCPEAPVAGAGKVRPKAVDLKPDETPEALLDNEAEHIVDSEDEGGKPESSTTKGVFKDRKPLKGDVNIPQSLADQASARLESLCEALQTSDEQMAEMMKAQAALRTMQKESAECPDRAMQEELEAEENEKNCKRDKLAKGRGRGRGGRGRGRSRKGRGKGLTTEDNDDNKNDGAHASHTGDAEIPPPQPAVEEEEMEKEPMVEPSQDVPPNDVEVAESPVKKPRLCRRTSRKKLQRLKVLSPSSSGKKTKKRKQYDEVAQDSAEVTEAPGQEDEVGWDFREENEPGETGAKTDEAQIPKPKTKKPKRVKKVAKQRTECPKAASSAIPEGQQQVPETPAETHGEKSKEELAKEKEQKDKENKWALLQDLAKKDGDLSLPEEIPPGKSFTVYAREGTVPPVGSTCASIGILMQQARSSSASFFVSRTNNIEQHRREGA